MSPPPDALQTVRAVAAAIADPWFVVDPDDAVVAFNDAFHGLFPAAQARRLAGKRCKEIAQIPACAGEGCLRRSCTADGPLRLDEVEVTLGGRARQMIVSAAPVPLGEAGLGALIVLRDVGEEARVQREYQQLKEQVVRLERELEERVSARTRDLMAANAELTRLEREIARLKRGGY